MASVEEAQGILKALGMPLAQCNQLSGMTLIALCGLTPRKRWASAKRDGYTLTKGIMNHLERHYGIEYAPNTRETFRRQVLHQFVQGHIADRNPFAPGLPTNSPHTHYAVTEAALEAVQRYGTKAWDSAIDKFKREQGMLVKRYERKRAYNMVQIRLPDGHDLQLSPGKHNEVQKAIIEEFAPRFSPGADLLYLGDTANKRLFVDQDSLVRLGIKMTEHDALPDVILYNSKQNFLFLVEAVTSHGAISPKRVIELENMTKACKTKSFYISAFPNFDEFRKHMKAIAWDTEVWLSDTPDHMIHYNGARFLGPGK